MKENIDTLILDLSQIGKGKLEWKFLLVDIDSFILT